MDWQPIETAPKDGTYVLLYQDDEDYPPMQVDRWVVPPSRRKQLPEREGWWENVTGNPTHWMRLPDPPQPEAGSRPED